MKCKFCGKPLTRFKHGYVCVYCGFYVKNGKNH